MNLFLDFTIFKNFTAEKIARFLAIFMNECTDRTELDNRFLVIFYEFETRKGRHYFPILGYFHEFETKKE